MMPPATPAVVPGNFIQAPTIERADYWSAGELSRQLAVAFGVSESSVMLSLQTVPDALLTLLASPDGWSALASFIAPDFGLLCNTYRPTVH